jgi:hypothetical protein
VPDAELITEIGHICREAGVELEIFERSRIARFLDLTAEGQYLRRKFLGVRAERLSVKLLKSLGRESLAQYRAQIPSPCSLIPRVQHQSLAVDMLGRHLTFLSGPSGFGKTASCIQLMELWLDKGWQALWLSETSAG